MKKQRLSKNLLTVLLAVLLMVNAVPAMVFAEEEDIDVKEAVVEVIEEPAEPAPAPEQETVKEEEAPVIKEEAPVIEETVQVKEEEAAPAEITENIEEAVEEVLEEAIPAEDIEEALEEDVNEDVTLIEEKADLSLASAATSTATDKVRITIHFCGIKNTDGTEKEMIESNSLSAGSGWNITQKKFDNKITIKKFSYKGTTYEYAGQWVDSSGSVVTYPQSFKGKDYSSDTDIYFYAVYNVIEPSILDFRYIDNISTGSGSWTNSGGTFTTMTHTFKQPESQPHYQFLYWMDSETGNTYGKGDKVTYRSSDIPAGTTRNVRYYAYWKPSTTVNYHDDNGTLLNSVETFDAYSLYSFNPEARQGEQFLGWSASIGSDILSDQTYEELSPVSSRVDQKIVNVYGVWSTDYSVEHYIEELDGSYSLRESEKAEGAIVGSTAAAQSKEYKGFTYDSSIEGTVTEAKVKAGLVLRLYYSRNSYTVTYAFDNAPEGAMLPEAVSYKYEERVEPAQVDEVKGHTFSGWDHEAFDMPAEDVIISGSWQINKYTVTWVDHNGKILEVDEEVEYGSMPSYDGKTPSRKATATHKYSFEGWSPEVSEVEDDITYTAVYKKKAIPVTPVTPEGGEPTPPTTIEPTEPKEPEAPIAEAPLPLSEPEAEEAVLEIEEAEVPMAVYEEERSWALINLIATIAAAIIALGMAITFFRKKDEEEDEENKTEVMAVREDEEQEEDRNGRRPAKFLGLIPAIAAIIIFILTEDMRLRMVLTDRYTILMVVIALVNPVLAILTRNRKEDDEEKEEEDQDAAPVLVNA